MVFNLCLPTRQFFPVCLVLVLWHFYMFELLLLRVACSFFFETVIRMNVHERDPLFKLSLAYLFELYHRH